ncbi:hypothetical protein SAMN05660860_03382 [Geoalkalibacter ferrihydriticus]|uniref:Uncharacterized protein n=1 Tax=Geoalkalibacter ferrihydriticus TaxID=392333 RepID=A0A1G9X656_9BACT|nr:hypothetical protein SAMN05660860_03382 [Geoalkalibacter ferrihydriticus]
MRQQAEVRRVAGFKANRTQFAKNVLITFDRNATLNQLVKEMGSNL